MIAAVTLGFLALAKAPGYNLTWRTKVGAQATYFIHAKSSSEGRSVVIDTNLTGKVTEVEDGTAQKFTLSTTKSSAQTSVETDPIPDVNGVTMDIRNPSSDLRKLGMLANIPGYIFVPVSKTPRAVGQSWARDLGGRWKVEAVSKIKTVPVIKVSLTGDDARLDSMSGTYWISVADGSVVRAQIHTQRDPGVNTELSAIQWDIFLDRLDLPSRK